ncbi:hypothetical protein [Paraburkholderia flava]|uniref:hypothetical protein n=1 Tax=Paraburkholderia flava TaxID=2547393 RepID=UPI00105CFF5E|nr:hypothetical protein [Paraburkholderia flava]
MDNTAVVEIHCAGDRLEDGQRVIKPMHYHCDPAGKSKFTIRSFQAPVSLVNSLERFWKGQLGYSHGLALVDGFYENVKRHCMEGRELEPGEEKENIIIEFRREHRRADAHCLLVVALNWCR